MTKEELVAKRDALKAQLDKMIKDMLDDKKVSYKKYDKTVYEYNDVLGDLDVIEGRAYNDEEWITKKTFTSEKSLSDARLNLAKMLSQLKGVEVEEKAGVQTVTVTTKWKIYYFVIHAHYEYEELEFEEKIIFGKTIKTCSKGRTVYTASLHKREYPYWVWKY